MKQNKIIVAVHPDEQVRRKIIQRILVKLSFANTPTDASKLIRPTVHDFDLAECYYVCAATYNLRDSPITRQRLFELAARGIAVIIGTKRLQAEFEFISEAVYE
ncbi:MAG: hypothetical protein A2W86_11745 [Bacteroidetes bacterium GWD2_45_23]|nr:MAG: hypothetical protein A2W87_08270 [Bacteroidetes bacterium GWC2_46_850]OFX70115.1 MAG: hypothetical protein A2071_04520 [Bacteroidetes bacterium GWC1_47_7]OFX85494.1 MAG: hypothetical protein A2W86_11745 [Bacteroidetes bacterium GWD2_45_23]HBB00718.1 hypothetical protein [Porphyromonadaceae bacterium]HCC19343.1 hypothetical protein [Porphyromonadaceae bacterium]